MRSIKEIEKEISKIEKKFMFKETTSCPNLIGEINADYSKDPYIDSAIRIRKVLTWVINKK